MGTVISRLGINLCRRFRFCSVDPSCCTRMLEVLVSGYVTFWKRRESICCPRCTVRSWVEQKHLKQCGHRRMLPLGVLFNNLSEQQVGSWVVSQLGSINASFGNLMLSSRQPSGFFKCAIVEREFLSHNRQLGQRTGKSLYWSSCTVFSTLERVWMISSRLLLLILIMSLNFLAASSRVWDVRGVANLFTEPKQGRTCCFGALRPFFIKRIFKKKKKGNQTAQKRLST